MMRTRERDGEKEGNIWREERERDRGEERERDREREEDKYREEKRWR